MAAAGYEVVLIAPGAPSEDVSGIRVEGIRKRSNRIRRITLTLFDVWRKARKERADIYHFHDPELIVVGLLLKAGGRTVVYDVHEHLPNQIMGKTYLGPKPVRIALAAAARLAERIAGLVFDAFCVVAPSLVPRFPSAKTVLVRNFVQLDLVDSVPRSTTSADVTVLIYPGSLSRARGIGNVIDAVGRLEGRAELWLFGKWHDRNFENRCRSSDGWRYTRYFGRGSQEEVFAHIKAADIGVHLPLPSPNYSDGLAVKGFEFMACAKPFVTTDEPAKRHTFAGCALFADAANVQSIVDSLLRLMTEGELRETLGNRGRSRVEEEFSWERESATLLGLYGRIGTGNPMLVRSETRQDYMK